MTGSTGGTASLNMDLFRDMLLDSAGVGLAVLEPPDLKIVLFNSTFASWFPTVGSSGLGLGDVVPQADAQTVLERTGSGDSWRAEIEIKPVRRPITLAVTVAKAEGTDSGALIIQCQNVSKIKEMEFMIESYSKMIERQNRDLSKEKERVEKLLLNIMPQSVYEEWKEFGITTPQRFDNATVLMLDFVGFTQMSIAHEPVKLIAELNDIFTSFDRIVEQFGCERLKTIGDAYMAVSGLPEPNPDHARNIARVALRFLRYLERRNLASEFEWRCRIGIDSSPVIGSVVGVQKYVYDIFGPGVNLAARLEPICGPMEVLVSENTAKLIQNEFRLTDRGRHDIRGFGDTRIFKLDGSLDRASEA